MTTTFKRRRKKKKDGWKGAIFFNDVVFEHKMFWYMIEQERKHNTEMGVEKKSLEEEKKLLEEEKKSIANKMATGNLPYDELQKLSERILVIDQLLGDQGRQGRVADAHQAIIGEYLAD